MRDLGIIDEHHKMIGRAKANVITAHAKPSFRQNISDAQKQRFKDHPERFKKSGKSDVQLEVAS